MFERSLNRAMSANHDAVVDWAEEMAIHARAGCSGREDSALVNVEVEGVVKSVVDSFRSKFAGSENGLRILIHRPPFSRSPGGFSLFNNLAEALKFIGIPTSCLDWSENLREMLCSFSPSVFITSDSLEYLAKIDWRVLKEYRKKKRCYLGLTASLEEYGNSPLLPRLKWGSEHRVDFYYSFRTSEYLKARVAYRPYFDSGYNIISVEFGANPLLYFPVPSIPRDLDYVFLASSNPDKRERYYQYLSVVFREYPGFINGPGWRHSRRYAGADLHRFLYARAKVGINLHISDSIEWASELNERTYILAACGVPQLVDDAKLLPSRFSADAFFVGRTPEEYLKLFREVLSNPKEANRRAGIALNEVYSRHTTFHRAQSFANALWGTLDFG
jgi:hypothetical protein